MRAAPSPLELLGRSVLVFAGLATFAGGLTTLTLGAQSLMDVGGVCASGTTAFEIRQECPEGIPLAVAGGIFIGGFGLFVYHVASFRQGGPRLTLLAWPALFLTLGIVMTTTGFNPPEEFGEGIAWGPAATGIMFLVMALAPVPLVFFNDWARQIFWGPSAEEVEARSTLPPWASRGASHRTSTAASASVVGSGTARVVDVGEANLDEVLGEGFTDLISRVTGTAVAGAPAAGGAGGTDRGDVVAQLERLSRLHAAGSLSDAEYAAAKQAVLGDQ